MQNNGTMRDCVVLIFIFIGAGGGSSRSRIFHSIGDVTIIGYGLQILTFARHSWPQISEGSYLTCHTYCDTDQPFIMVISGKPVLLTNVVERLALEMTLPVIETGLSRPGMEPRSPECEAVVLNGNDLFRDLHHLFYSVLYFRPLWANLKLW